MVKPVSQNAKFSAQYSAIFAILIIFFFFFQIKLKVRQIRFQDQTAFCAVYYYSTLVAKSTLIAYSSVTLYNTTEPFFKSPNSGHLERCLFTKYKKIYFKDDVHGIYLYFVNKHPSRWLLLGL